MTPMALLPCSKTQRADAITSPALRPFRSHIIDRALQDAWWAWVGAVRALRTGRVPLGIGRGGHVPAGMEAEWKTLQRMRLRSRVGIGAALGVRSLWSACSRQRWCSSRSYRCRPWQSWWASGSPRPIWSASALPLSKVWRSIRRPEPWLHRQPLHRQVPALRHPSPVKQRYGPEFERAVEAAFALLDARSGNVLRLHFIEGLTPSAIAAMHRVSVRSVQRWIASAERELLANSRRILGDRLNLSPSELDSLLGLVRSQLSLTLHRL